MCPRRCLPLLERDDDMQIPQSEQLQHDVPHRGIPCLREPNDRTEPCQRSRRSTFVRESCTETCDARRRERRRLDVAEHFRIGGEAAEMRHRGIQANADSAPCKYGEQDACGEWQYPPPSSKRSQSDQPAVGWWQHVARPEETEKRERDRWNDEERKHARRPHDRRPIQQPRWFSRPGEESFDVGAPRAAGRPRVGGHRLAPIHRRRELADCVLPGTQLGDGRCFPGEPRQNGLTSRPWARDVEEPYERRVPGDVEVRRVRVVVSERLPRPGGQRVPVSRNAERSLLAHDAPNARPPRPPPPFRVDGCKRDVCGGADGQSRDEQGGAAPPTEQQHSRRGAHDERDEPELRDALDLALQDPFAVGEARRPRGVVPRGAA